MKPNKLIQITPLLFICTFSNALDSVNLESLNQPTINSPQISSPTIDAPTIKSPNFTPKDPPKDSINAEKIKTFLSDVKRLNLQMKSYCLPKNFWSTSAPTTSRVKQIGIPLVFSKAQYMKFIDVLQESLYTILQQNTISKNKALESSVEGELVGVSCVIEFIDSKASKSKTTKNNATNDTLESSQNHFIAISNIIQVDDMFFEKSQIITQALKKHFCHQDAQ